MHALHPPHQCCAFVRTHSIHTCAQLQWAAMLLMPTCPHASQYRSMHWLPLSCLCALHVNSMGGKRRKSRQTRYQEWCRNNSRRMCASCSATCSRCDFEHCAQMRSQSTQHLASIQEQHMAMQLCWQWMQAVAQIHTHLTDQSQSASSAQPHSEHTLAAFIALCSLHAWLLLRRVPHLARNASA